MSKTPRTTKSEAIRTLAAYGHAACDRVEQLETELADKEKQLAEARADLRFAKNIIEMHVERVAERDKLIGQMREALDATDEYYLDKSYAGKAHNTPIVVKVREAQAALSAAERGE